MLGAAVSAALFAGVANATITVGANGIPVITPADTYQIYLAGSSAARGFVDQLFTNSKVPGTNRLCDITKTVYRYQNTGNGTDQNAYLCVINGGNAALKGLAAGKKNLLVYKRNLGGSAAGVNPVIDDSAIDFLKVDNAANCTAPTFTGVAGTNQVGTINCNFTAGNTALSQSVIPDFGISDVEPLMFQGVNTPSGFNAVTASDVTKLTVKAAAAQVFGIVVNTKLRNALQEAQFKATTNCNPTNANYTAATAESLACMPTLDSAQIASIFTGKIASWKQIKISSAGNLFINTTVAANLPGSDIVHVCSRTNGSGTKAQFGAKFLNYPCSDFATQPVADTGSLPESIIATQVHQMGSSGQLGECLNDLNNGVDNTGSFINTYGVRWAIGIQGTENNANRSSQYRFIKVDGVEPTLENVANGRYKDWGELTFQYNNNHVFDLSEQAIVNEIIKEMGNPAVMAITNTSNNTAVHSWGNAGFMAVPQSFAAAVSGIVNSAKPVNPLSHGTTSASPSTCRAPALYAPGSSFTNGLQLIK